MSERTTAALSHGIIVVDAITPPIPYDVRFGVNNGAGQLGTLTSPAESDVRNGVEYGGGGDQYTGTLNFTVGGTSWTDEMDEVFEDMVNESEYRTSITYNSHTIYGVKMALSLGFQMQLSGYQRKADTSVDIRRSDAVSSGLYAACAPRQPSPVTRPSVAVLMNGEAMFVIDLKDDNATDPTVKLILAAAQ